MKKTIHPLALYLLVGVLIALVIPGYSEPPPSSNALLPTALIALVVSFLIYRYLRRR